MSEIDASSLRDCSPREAIEFTDSVLGDSSIWGVSVVARRLDSESDLLWKIEVGRWLQLAEALGFLPDLQNRLDRARNEAASLAVSGPNESAHRILVCELAPVLTVYYLIRCGWTFVSWEPPVDRGDVDIRLRCPAGVRTDVQVKAPDRPGEVREYRIVDGENDRHVLRALDKAIAQVSGAPGPQRIVVISPQRVFPIAPKELSKYLIGHPKPVNGEPVLRPDDRGVFASGAGVLVGAVVDLSLLIRFDPLEAVDNAVYRCVAFFNPWASSGSSPALASFPFATTCGLEGQRFRWRPQQPDAAFSLPDGTRYETETIPTDGA